MTQPIRAIASALLLFGAGGCAAVLPAAVGLSTVGGSLAIADHVTSIFGNTLTNGAKLACVIQSYANLKKDAQLSYDAGQFCRW
ncbi:MAG: hypothetical protein KGL39_03400 [Patescibacteria group bacterium]|nr:hypothetical protein [Patescibacteria group bacterium]